MNAMLNAVFSVTAGRLAAALQAAGAHPAVGFLHADKRGRWSLAWDAIEPLRPTIEARVFRLIEHERFDVRDFVRAPDESLRLAPGLLSIALNACAPPSATLAGCVRWLGRLVLSAEEGVTEKAEQRLRHVGGLSLAVGGGALEFGDLSRIGVNLRRERLQHRGGLLGCCRRLDSLRRR